MSNAESPDDGGASSVESWDDEQACTFDPETGFAINRQSLDTLRWYSYLAAADDGDETAVQSRNDE